MERCGGLDKEPEWNWWACLSHNSLFQLCKDLTQIEPIQYAKFIQLREPAEAYGMMNSNVRHNGLWFGNHELDKIPFYHFMEIFAWALRFSLEEQVEDFVLFILLLRDIFKQFYQIFFI